MNAEQRKRKVLKSKAFNDWWEARQEHEPVPSNPYRAFMIDQSLHAIIDTRDRWEQEPNRRDVPNVDSPYEGVPTYAPSRKPRRRRAVKEKSPSIPKKGLAREVYLQNMEMATKHGLPAPKVTARHVSPLFSSARVGVGRIQGDPKIYTFGGSGEIKVGTKGKKPIVLATAGHESGHVIHAQSLAKGKPLEGITPFKGTRSSFSDELMATKIARTHLKKSKSLKKKGEYPKATWFLKYALDTYRQGWKKRNKPVKVNKKGMLVSGGELA